MKVTDEKLTVLSFLRFSRNVFGQEMLVFHILILIHKGAKLYSQRRENLKIMNSAPELKRIFYSFNLKLNATAVVLIRCQIILNYRIHKLQNYRKVTQIRITCQ